LHIFATGSLIGKYRFENQNDNAKQFDDDKGTNFAEIQPAPASAFQDSIVAQYFMGYIANHELILRFPNPTSIFHTFLERIVFAIGYKH